MVRVKKPSGDAPVAPAPATTMIGPHATKPPAKQAPSPAATLVGPHATKPPRKQPRAGTLPGRAVVPRPAAKPRPLPPDRTKPLRALGRRARWRIEDGMVRELRLDGNDAGCTARNVAAVLAAEPITELALEGCDPDLLAQLLALPGLERVTRLAVSGWIASDGGTFVGKVLAKAKRLTAVTELRAGIELGDAGLAALAKTEALGAVTHLALGVPRAPGAFARLAASPIGQQLETLEWLRDELSAELVQLVVTLPSLRTFVASLGHTRGFDDVLAARFRDRLVIEDQPGKTCVIDGVAGVSFRPPPKR